MDIDFMGMPLAPEGGSRMSKFYAKSFAFVASIVGAALITGAASAETAALVPERARGPRREAAKEAPKEVAKESDGIGRCGGH